MDQKLFYEDELDALKTTVLALGGNKAVGRALWPDNAPDTAGKLMADCCNPGRSERLSPSQLLMVMRMGREKNFHALAEHFMAEAGYATPKPVNPQDEAAVLMERMEGFIDQASQLAGRMEKLRNFSSVRAVA